MTGVVKGDRVVVEMPVGKFQLKFSGGAAAEALAEGACGVRSLDLPTGEVSFVVSYSLE